MPEGQEAEESGKGRNMDSDMERTRMSFVLARVN